MIQYILSALLYFHSLSGINTNTFHAIHVSKCEIQFNEEASTFEVAVQIYVDDLQTSLTKLGSPDLHLCTDRESKQADSVLKIYLEKQLTIDADGKALKSTFIGKEPSEDHIAVWCYIEFKSPATFKQLKVKYDVLMDLYDDQKNIVNIKVKEKKGYLLLHQKHKDETIQY